MASKLHDPSPVTSHQSPIRVEVVYALRDEQVLLALEVEEGTTVRQAIEQSGITSRFPEIRVASERVGLFGTPARLDTKLKDGDRVEIYRPLIADPKTARRTRARRGSASGRGR